MNRDMIRTDVYAPIKDLDNELSSLYDYAEEEGLDDRSLELIDNVQTALHNLIVHLQKEMAA